MSVESILLFVGTIMVVAVFVSKIMSRYGVPTLVIFMVLGMLLGSEKIGVNILHLKKHCEIFEIVL